MFKTAAKIRSMCEKCINDIEQKKSTAWFRKNMDKEMHLLKKKHREFLVSFCNHPGDDQYTFKMLRITQEFEDIENLLHEIAIMGAKEVEFFHKK